MLPAVIYTLEVPKVWAESSGSEKHRVGRIKITMDIPIEFL